MKIWILVAIALALLVWGLVREPFEATQSIKAPPYNAAENIRIFDMVRQRSAKPPYTFLGHQDKLMAKAKAKAPNEKNETKLKEIAGEIISPAVAEFFVKVFKPATRPVTEDDVNTFLTTWVTDMTDIERDLLVTYFVAQSGVGRGDYASSLASVGQNAGYLVSNKPEASPSPLSGPAVGGTSTSTLSGSATDGTSSSTSAGGTSPGMFSESATDGLSSSTTTGTTAGGTTGGSSTNSAAPNSGSASNRKVFGPLYTSKGAPIAGGGLDTSKTNQYPELMGGGLPDTSVRSAEGVSNPSQSWLLSQSGALPSTASLGSDADSSFLPTSRVPGDQDLIPDPYRMSRNYSTASYSSKTDPVPFLTDFSAFQK